MPHGQLATEVNLDTKDTQVYFLLNNKCHTSKIPHGQLATEVNLDTTDTQACFLLNSKCSKKSKKE